MTFYHICYSLFLGNFYACVQNPDGVLKMRKLRKLVIKALEESGITGDETQLSEKLEHKVSHHVDLGVFLSYCDE